MPLWDPPLGNHVSCIQSIQSSLELVLLNTYTMIICWRGLLKKLEIAPTRTFSFSVKDLAIWKKKQKYLIWDILALYLSTEFFWKKKKIIKDQIELNDFLLQNHLIVIRSHNLRGRSQKQIMTEAVSKKWVVTEAMSMV